MTTQRIVALAALALLTGCGSPYTLRVQNDYPFPVEVIQRQAGDRLSRQDEPLGTVPAHAGKTFTGSHPYVSETAVLAVVTQDGRTLRVVRDPSAPGYSTESDGRRTTGRLRVGPAAAR